MASTERGHGPAPGGRGYETRDISVKGAVLLTLAVALLVPAALVAMNLLFDHFAAREVRNQPTSRSLIPKEANPLPPSPRLQDNPYADLKEHRSEEAAKANRYAWLDRKAGRVRIPVARAMDLLLERGLPARPAATGGDGKGGAKP